VVTSNVQQEFIPTYPGEKVITKQHTFNDNIFKESLRHRSVNGNKNIFSQITERQSGEAFSSRRRACRAQPGRQCRRRQVNNTSRIFETEDEYPMYPEESRPTAESFFHPKGNLRDSDVKINIHRHKDCKYFPRHNQK
jgi:hypothetical protein